MKENSGRPAVYFLGRRMTYSELGEYVDAMAEILRDQGGVSRGGSRVMVLMPNVPPHYIVTFFACMKLGAVVVQANPLYTVRELSYELSDSGSSTLVTVDIVAGRLKGLDLSGVRVLVLDTMDFLPGGKAMLFPLSRQGREARGGSLKALGLRTVRIRVGRNGPPEKVDPAKHPALIQYTGGTTGMPKGAVLSHRNLVANAYQIIEWLPEKYRKHTSYLSAAPFFHVYGMMTAMLLPLIQGATMYLVPDPPRDTGMIVDYLERFGPTAFPGIPTMYHSIVSRKDISARKINRVKVCISGAMPLPVELQKRFEEVTGGATLVEAMVSASVRLWQT
ncbi:AMP-binding protein [Thermogymnomonas acidicola]|uniref:AMP-binding protein n=1 Tax=Thermogymnomonas acidicola TaxID=399579 RepID=UPI000AE5B01A|nr:AMP-binding protein [Thermogymnomonas acidicola]